MSKKCRYIVIINPGQWDEMNIHCPTLRVAVDELKRTFHIGVIYDTKRKVYYRLKENSDSHLLS